MMAVGFQSLINEPEPLTSAEIASIVVSLTYDPFDAKRVRDVVPFTQTVLCRIIFQNRKKY